MTSFRSRLTSFVCRPAVALLLAAAMPIATAQHGTARAGRVTPFHSAGEAPQPWWKGAVLYEVYPRSFQDSNGDGIGDLNGITSRLDYLQSLHVNALWLTPMYPSPQVDFGYDISDYRQIDPMYGTMADFDRLVAEGKKRGIGIIVDLVLNHTSDQHPWFAESRISRTNPKADWYMWRDAKPGGGVPNNWTSLFGGSAWEWNADRKQYYYHRFYKQQPDLNWRNPEVQEAMFDICRFWLRHGVAGFRLDAIPALFEDEQMRDAKALGGTNAYGDPALDQTYVKNLPEMHPMMRRLRALVDSFPGEHVLIGETNLPPAQLREWYGSNHDELQLPMDMYLGMLDKLDPAMFRDRLEQSETGLGGNLPLLVFDNHDRRRSWDRYGNGMENARIARMIATMQLTARGTALLYYGQELGMVTTPPRSIEEVQDPIGRTGWPAEKGRDGERTPMQWTPGLNAGFSSAAKTWLPVPAQAARDNVETESRDRASMLSWYRQLLDLRAATPALSAGPMRMLSLAPALVAYTRGGDTPGEQEILVIMNMSAEPQAVRLTGQPGVKPRSTLRPLVQNADIPAGAVDRPLTIPPYASVVAALVP